MQTGNITIAGETGKNVNCFAKSIVFKDSAVINGNSILVGQYVNTAGITKGSARIWSETIVLSGEFLGDVDVDVNINNTTDKMSDNVNLTVLPGTKIHGKLSYKSITEAEIAPGAQIGQKEWIKASSQLPKNQQYNYPIWISRKILTLGVYFLLGLLLYKMFPNLFKRQADFIQENPLGTLGRGAIAVFSPLLVLLVVVLLFTLSIVAISPSVGLIFTAAFTGFYTLVFYFSTIPVALWLGNRLFKEKHKTLFNFALGLIIINFVQIALELLCKVAGAGTAFNVISAIFTLTILIFGSGALSYGIQYAYQAIRQEAV
ncbi:MAG: hypothetical protein AWM53_01588 [Candidatus Dichloromethanomonas elyunquensis]|nr:MAG: hypothetical protein AWM53_01588 [Candidatus Dichloromethanomonas elyunquensis]